MKYIYVVIHEELPAGSIANILPDMVTTANLYNGSNLSTYIATGTADLNSDDLLSVQHRFKSGESYEDIYIVDLFKDITEYRNTVIMLIHSANSKLTPGVAKLLDSPFVLTAKHPNFSTAVEKAVHLLSEAEKEKSIPKIDPNPHV